MTQRNAMNDQVFERLAAAPAELDPYGQRSVDRLRPARRFNPKGGLQRCRPPERHELVLPRIAELREPDQ